MGAAEGVDTNKLITHYTGGSTVNTWRYHERQPRLGVGLGTQRHVRQGAALRVNRTVVIYMHTMHAWLTVQMLWQLMLWQNLPATNVMQCRI